MNRGKLVTVSLEVREFIAENETYDSTCKLCDFSRCIYCPFGTSAETCGARYFKFTKEVVK